MRTFKKMRGIKLPYKKQGMIYFTCQNIQECSEETQEHIKELCREIAGADYEALFAVLTSETETVRSVATRYYVAERKLYQLRKSFYEAWKK